MSNSISAACTAASQPRNADDRAGAGTGALPHYLTQFPDFGLMDVVIPDGFTDQSWFKNTCPSFELAGPDNYASGWPLLTIFIDYADTSLRAEAGDVRYHVYVGAVSDHADLRSDDWADVVSFVEQYRRGQAS